MGAPQCAVQTGRWLPRVCHVWKGGAKSLGVRDGGGVGGGSRGRGAGHRQHVGGGPGTALAFTWFGLPGHRCFQEEENELLSRETGWPVGWGLVAVKSREPSRASPCDILHPAFSRHEGGTWAVRLVGWSGSGP